MSNFQHFFLTGTCVSVCLFVHRYDSRAALAATAAAVAVTAATGMSVTALGTLGLGARFNNFANRLLDCACSA